MFPEIPNRLKWRRPWQPLTESNELLVEELYREISSGHALCGVNVKAVGRRDDRDDVLFLTDDISKPIALVHLTWRGQVEPDPLFPMTRFFVEWNEPALVEILNGWDD